MNVMVLGANGQLGHDICRVLAHNQNLSVIKITRNEFDASIDLDNIATKFNGLSVDIIINCIAVTNVDWCEANGLTAFNVNTIFVCKLAQFCKQKNIVLFQISTDYVFDGLNEFEYQEFDEPHPQNIYGMSKYGSEITIPLYHDKYFIFRVSGLFGKVGASGKGGNFITTMQRLAKEKAEINVIADQVSNPTSTLAVARCIAHFIDSNMDKYGIYHCVSCDSISWYDFARKILNLSGLDANKIKPIDFKDYSFVAQRPQNSVLSVRKLNEFYTMPTIDDSLNEYFTL